MTKTPGSLSGVKLHLEAGQITEESEAGCPDGTTILVRDLFFNTPARMKFMKSDTVEGSRVAAAVQMQALAHPEVAFQFLRDGKQVLSTPGTGELQAAMYCIYGRDCARMVRVESRWEGYTLTGFVTLPTDARPSRNWQTFFVNDRPVKSRLLISALEEAYRNQMMVGKFPGCVLHLHLPANAVDVNVHPAKTEVKFLAEKAVFDCVHYGVLGALNKKPDRPAVQFKQPQPAVSAPPVPPAPKAVEPPKPAPVPQKPTPAPAKKEPFFRTMTTEEYKTFSAAMEDATKPKPQEAAAAAQKIPRPDNMPLREFVMLPQLHEDKPEPPKPVSPPPVPPKAPEPEVEQTELPMPAAPQWRMVGELYNTYILVEEGEDAFLIDKHAAHERILFEKLKANQEAISAQSLLQPVPVRLTPAAAGELLSNTALLEELGFEIEEFGDNTVLARQIPMDLSPDAAAEALETLAEDLLNGRRERKDTVRDTLLHTVACKAAIKAGCKNDEKELLAVAEAVMSREDLKYCPHGRPICVSLSKKQLEKQFKRT